MSQRQQDYERPLKGGKASITRLGVHVDIDASEHRGPIDAGEASAILREVEEALQYLMKRSRQDELEGR